jgi:hypothetical protein
LQSPDTLPDYHFVLIAPGLSADWFFDTLPLYFDRFRPTVIADFSFLQLVPIDYSLVVTVIARRDSAPTLGVQLAQLRPAALFDPIVLETPAEVRQVMDQRAALNQPFGVPLRDIAREDPTLLPSIPTPLLPMQPAGDWVTVTPAPSGSEPSPTAPPATTEPLQPIPPITPTPGSLIGS